MATKTLTNAKINKNDEFYTLYEDIAKEIEMYVKYNNNVFKDKIVLLPCDNPSKSNFTKFFIDNFDRFGLKKLISTSYEKENSFGKILIIDKDNRNINNIKNLKTNGDFRNDEITKYKNECDIIITNPPFSLFRNFFHWIMESNKQFLIIGNINCITYKDIFNEIKNNNVWLGTGLGRWISGFVVPEEYELYGTETKIENTQRIIATNNCLWLTNIEHNKRHESITLHSMEYNLTKNNTLINRLNKYYGCLEYPKYDNYDAIEVPITNAIPNDYKGIMGVPITFLDKYNPNDFEIIKFRKGNDDKDLSINGKTPYFRILIKKK